MSDKFQRWQRAYELVFKFTKIYYSRYTSSTDDTVSSTVHFVVHGHDAMTP